MPYFNAYQRAGSSILALPNGKGPILCNLAGSTDVPLQNGTYMGDYFAPRLITAVFRAQF